jgi:hypothetical protein
VKTQEGVIKWEPDIDKEKGVTSTYEGESSRSAYTRGLEHKADLAKRDLDSPLWKHCSIHHQDTEVPFNMEVTGIHKSAMHRLSDEIVRIRSTNSPIILNSKNDWAQPALIRVVPVVGNISETQLGDTGQTRQQRRAAGIPSVRPSTQGESSPGRRRRRRESTVFSEVNESTADVIPSVRPSDMGAATPGRRRRRGIESTAAEIPSVRPSDMGAATPVRRKRRGAAAAATTPGRAAASQPTGAAGDRESRRSRREELRSSQP